MSQRIYTAVSSNLSFLEEIIAVKKRYTVKIVGVK